MAVEIMMDSKRDWKRLTMDSKRDRKRLGFRGKKLDA